MMRAWGALLIAACVEENLARDMVSWDDGVVEVAPPPALPAGYLLLGVSPVDQLDAYTMTVSGAPANASVMFLRGEHAGSGACPPLLGGECLQVRRNVQQLGVVVANAMGEAVFQRQMPALGLGRTLGLQAVVTGRTSWLSEAEERPVRPPGGNQPFDMGPAFQLPSASSVAPDVLLGHPIVVPEPVELLSLGVIGRAGSTDVRMAVYEDAGGVPGRLVAWTDPFVMAAGRTSAPVRQQPLRLAAGTWWLMSNFEGHAATWANGPLPGPEAAVTLSFHAPLPLRLVQPAAYTSPRINAFMIVR